MEFTAHLLAGSATRETPPTMISVEGKASCRSATRPNGRATLRERLSRFRGILRGTLPNTPYEKAAPTLPELNAVQSKFLAPLDDMASLWARINADTATPGFTPPLTIADYSLADFQADLAGLRASFAAVTAAENDLDLARKERDALLPPAKERMVQYRAMVEATFGAEHPLTLTLPTLSSSPGSTPDAVTVGGEWDAVAGEAVLTWNGSTNSNLLKYEIRVSSGATYDAATASVAGQVLAGTEEFRTTQELLTPGDTATFKVYVILTTGNEAGSNTVSITRM